MAITGAHSGTVVDGGGYSTNTLRPFPYTGLNGTGESTGTGPIAYLNYIMFDRDFHPIIEDHSQTGFERVDESAKENGKTNLTNPVNGVEHQLLQVSVTVKQAGYLYIYLSNEESSCNRQPTVQSFRQSVIHSFRQQEVHKFRQQKCRTFQK